jgi:hypothetical protein
VLGLRKAAVSAILRTKSYSKELKVKRGNMGGRGDVSPHEQTSGKGFWAVVLAWHMFTEIVQILECSFGVKVRRFALFP